MEIGHARPVVDAHKRSPGCKLEGDRRGPVEGGGASDQPGDVADEWHSCHEHLRARQACGGLRRQGHSVGARELRLDGVGGLHPATDHGALAGQSKAAVGAADDGAEAGLPGVLEGLDGRAAVIASARRGSFRGSGRSRGGW